MAHTQLRRDLGRCLRYLRPHARDVGVVLAVTVISGGLPALEPLALRAVFDRLGAETRPSARALLGPVIFLAVLWTVRCAFERGQVLIAWRVRLAVNRDLLAEVTARLHRLPLAYHQGSGVGETMTRLDRGITSLMEGLSSLTFQALPAAIYVVVATVTMIHL